MPVPKGDVRGAAVRSQMHGVAAGLFRHIDHAAVRQAVGRPDTRALPLTDLAGGPVPGQVPAFLDRDPRVRVARVLDRNDVVPVNGIERVP